MVNAGVPIEVLPAGIVGDLTPRHRGLSRIRSHQRMALGGLHNFAGVNNAGESHWLKFYFKPDELLPTTVGSILPT